jgi:erythronate-4-phosphate dehydrogenase
MAVHGGFTLRLADVLARFVPTEQFGRWRGAWRKGAGSRTRSLNYNLPSGSKNAQIVADSGIPGIFKALSPFGTVRLMAPANMSSTALEESDILIVRSVATVGKELLEGSRIRMVGSATAGTDHVDLTYLKEQGIAFSHAPGANADSVADYVLTALLVLAERDQVSLAGMCLGVVGCGQVGSRVARRAAGLGMTVLRNDPPLARQRPGGDYHSLDHLLAECDALTLHVPLTGKGEDRTAHLLDEHRLSGFRGWLINTARGSVVDGNALLKLRRGGRGPRRVVLDVWEGEPKPSADLADAVDIATGHIAGYARDSKFKATQHMRRAVAGFLGFDLQGEPDGPADVRLSPADVSPSPAFSDRWLPDFALRMCPLLRDDTIFRRALRTPDVQQAFGALRVGYPERRLMQRHLIGRDQIPPKALEAVRNGLGVQVLPS